MPIKELSKSMKAKLYDFTYTPFMSSMVIAWIILNHKYILIYMASFKLDKKLELLNKYDFSLHMTSPNIPDIPHAYSIFFPILFGLFYTFIYPWFSKRFYQYTLKRNKELKTIKQGIEDTTPITQEEARSLKKENYELTEEISKLEEKLATVRNDYNTKLTTIENECKTKITTGLDSKHQAKIKEIQQSHEQALKTKHKELEENYKDAHQVIVQERDTLAEHMSKLQTSHAKLEKENKDLLEKIPKKTEDRETDEQRILRFFYETNYKKSMENTVLDSIFLISKIPRPKAQKIINKLVDNKILSRTLDSNKYIEITDLGNNMLIKLFDKESK